MITLFCNANRPACIPHRQILSDRLPGSRFLPVGTVQTLIFLLIGLSATGIKAADRPNVVWILSEDNSKHYLQLFDPAGTTTPNIAAMAKEGVLFQRAFSNAPVCSVARTTLLTGCYAPRIGTQYHRRSKLAAMPTDVQMFPAYLRSAGYYTTNNSKEDYNAVKADNVWDDSSRKASWKNRPNTETPFFHMQTFGQSHEGSLHFSRKKMESEPTNHAPNKVTLAPYHPDTKTFRYTHARYLDRIQDIDQLVGEVIQQLEADGVLEETFVFYFGDHGGVLPRSKGYPYEAGLHVPLVVRVPEKFKDLSPLPRSSQTDGFVEFVDFGPTVLDLAGVEIPKGVDGIPFLGSQTTSAELEQRNETFGYADRFDEKYDMIRTLRIGDWKYIRNYESFLPAGLQNNYRYRMLAYQEWRSQYRQGTLNPMQQQFYQAKPLEGLYNLKTDPHEINNLAQDPQYQEQLVAMRTRLQERMQAMPDLSLIPESQLVAEGLDNPVQYGQKMKKRIAKYLQTVDLCLLPTDQAVPELQRALSSSDPMERMWAWTACCCIADQASELESLAHKQSTLDPHRLTRIRATQFLAILGKTDPRPAIYKELASTKSTVEALEILNTAVYIQDHLTPGLKIDPEQLQFSFDVDPKGEVARRVQYFSN